MFLKKNRGVAQLASVLAWGASGRPFESGHPDKKEAFSLFFLLYTFFGKGMIARSLYGLKIYITYSRKFSNKPLSIL